MRIIERDEDGEGRLTLAIERGDKRVFYAVLHAHVCEHRHGPEFPVQTCEGNHIERPGWRFLDFQGQPALLSAGERLDLERCAYGAMPCPCESNRALHAPGHPHNITRAGGGS